MQNSEIKKQLEKYDIYRSCSKGAGFYKYKIKNVWSRKTGITLGVVGTHWKKNAKSEFIECQYDDKEGLSLPDERWFCDLGLWMKRENKLWKIVNNIRSKPNDKKYKQFSHEYNEIKNKYPEKFI